MKKQTTTTPGTALDALLLRRHGAVAVTGGAAPGEPDPWSARGLLALEADLALRGYLLTGPLRSALGRLRPAGLAETGQALLRRLDASTGADRRHRPLFGRFPDGVPDHAHSYYSAQVRAFLLNQPHQLCAHCGRAAAESGIGALAPCAHLVCGDCYDDLEIRHDGRSCPLCGATIAPERYLPLDAKSVRNAARERGSTTLLRPLRLAEGTDRAVVAGAEAGRLLARRTPLDPQDREDLALLLDLVPADPADWLPADIPVRESRATVLAALLRRDPEAVRPLLPGLLTTATDVLRLIWAWSGAEPDLLPATAKGLRLRGLPRPLRRELLAVLDALPVGTVAEDLGRHRQAWLRAGELLHPYEYRDRFPYAAAAFAVLRQSDLDLHGLGPRWREAPAPLRVAETPAGHTRLVVRTFAAEVERALAGGDVPAAGRLLARRPGELVRRLHHLLRVHASWSPGEPLPAALADDVLPAALRRVAPGPLLGAYGRLRAPREIGERRLYFPRGRVTRAHARDDWGTVVPAALGAPVCALIEAELLRRAGQHERFELAVLDEGLADLVVPFAERAAARTLVSLPRGSVQRLPDGGRVRLFLHWKQQPSQRVDLDLSVALYDDRWQFTGLCDYTRLVHGARGAVHSGDFTSAPPPHGATEFVDLDLPVLAGEGARYAVVVVFSYNDIPFEELADAFAGFMQLDEGTARSRGGGRFHPEAVRQRLDLSGDAKVCVPMIVDLARRDYTWTDLNTSASGGFHNVWRYRDRIGTLAADVVQHFAEGSRATLWDLACAGAAARTDEVLVRDRTGGVVGSYRRAADEPVAAFAARLRERRAPDATATGPAEDTARALAGRLDRRRVFAALVHADLPAPAEVSGTLYRLYPGPLDAAPGTLERLTAGDVVALFNPEE
ncbi:MXAN_6230/SCO0854 family RING domain-containing protein [Kitasatospora sp. NPDC059327]|uniref:MXAN_6230/SCO0854 family RING domain-containing protein n=1 Tax=Kitasatospora sp. NPDC059327 TaxID=3346803 RepID=UPI0036AA7434